MLFKTKYFYCLAFLFGTFFIAGCSQPIRTLKALGVEKDAQAAQVERQNIKFELLLNDIMRDRLKTGVSRAKIEKRFGKPVLEEPLSDEGKTVLLYRKPTEFFDTEKIYLTFDKNNNLEKIEIEESDADQGK